MFFFFAAVVSAFSCWEWTIHAARYVGRVAWHLAAVSWVIYAFTWAELSQLSLPGLVLTFSGIFLRDLSLPLLPPQHYPFVRNGCPPNPEARGQSIRFIVHVYFLRQGGPSCCNSQSKHGPALPSIYYDHRLTSLSNAALCSAFKWSVQTIINIDDSSRLNFTT